MISIIKVILVKEKSDCIVDYSRKEIMFLILFGLFV